MASTGAGYLRRRIRWIDLKKAKAEAVDTNFDFKFLNKVGAQDFEPLPYLRI